MEVQAPNCKKQRHNEIAVLAKVLALLLLLLFFLLISVKFACLAICAET